MRKSSWIGLFVVLVALGGAAALIFLRPALTGCTFDVLLGNGGGLKAGDALICNGVTIGEVRGVAREGNGSVRASLLLGADNSVPGLRPRTSDLFVVWDNKLLTGVKCLIVLPDPGGQGPPIKRGDTVRGYGGRLEVIRELGLRKGLEMLNVLPAPRRGDTTHETTGRN